MDYKYLILDFGNVLVKSPTGSWDFTPKFMELIDMNKLDVNKFYEIKNKYDYILSEKITTLEAENDMFFRYYDSILSEVGYEGYNKDIAKQIAYNRTYGFDKYVPYEDVTKELNKLKEKYELIMLTDNWPCAMPYLEKYNLQKYFDKIYISSCYGEVKKDGLFFDEPIKDYNIKPGEALFIDDTEINLEKAKEHGLDVLLMDRENQVTNSIYPIIHNLNL